MSMTKEMARLSVHKGHCYWHRLNGGDVPAMFLVRRQFGDLGVLEAGICSECLPTYGPFESVTLSPGGKDG